MFIIYPLFGFIGGWGVGQFLEWIVDRFIWRGYRSSRLGLEYRVIYRVVAQRVLIEVVVCNSA